MICSMTGFGSARLECASGIFEVTLKGTNNRFLDFAFHLPSELNNLEMDIRKVMGRYVHRGRVEVWVRWIRTDALSSNLRLNVSLFERVYRDLAELRKRLGIKGGVTIGDILQIPGLYEEIPAEIDKTQLWRDLKKGITRAARALRSSRRAEGKRLAKALLSLLDDLESRHQEIVRLKDVVIEKYRQRLLKKMVYPWKKLR